MEPPRCGQNRANCLAREDVGWSGCGKGDRNQIGWVETADRMIPHKSWLVSHYPDNASSLHMRPTVEVLRSGSQRSRFQQLIETIIPTGSCTAGVEPGVDQPRGGPTGLIEKSRVRPASAVAAAN